MDKRAKILIGTAIGIAFLFLLGGAVKIYYQEQSQIVTEVEPNLTPESKQIYEQRRADARKLVDEINSETSDEDKFNRYVTLANVEFSLGKYSESKKWYLEALNVNPKHDGIWHVYSTLLAAMKDYKAALKAVDKVLSINSGNSDYWRWKIDLTKDHFYDQEKLNGLYIEALEKTNSDINMITAYAVFLEEIGNLQAAKEYWQKAIDKNGANRSQYQAEIARIDEKLKQQSQ